MDDLDDILFEEKLCTCPNPKAHKRDCPMSCRNLPRKTFFRPGDAVVLHLPGKPKKHLVCRIAQTNGALHTLHCNQGTLRQRFASDELQQTDATPDILLEKWRQGKVISIKELLDEELVDCYCQREVPHYHHVEDDTGNDKQDREDPIQIRTLLYTLSKKDVNFVDRRYEWINDKVVSASQDILAQQFPLIQGLQPPTLQEVRGFTVHAGEFVQIINVNHCHWCVVTTVGCESGQVKVYDTMYRTVQTSTVPIIASLVNCTSPSLKISMVDVGRQSNGSDCGVLSIAIAYDLCAGNNPSTVVYEHELIRQHLKLCLERCSLTRFPIQRPRETVGFVCTEIIPLYCSCRMPEDDDPSNPYAECTSCKEWFHRACANVPPDIFINVMGWSSLLSTLLLNTNS